MDNERQSLFVLLIVEQDVADDVSAKQIDGNLLAPVLAILDLQRRIVGRGGIVRHAQPRRNEFHSYRRPNPKRDPTARPPRSRVEVEINDQLAGCNGFGINRLLR